MTLETHAKIGIWVGIAAVIVIMPFLVLTQVGYLSHEFGALFVDQDALIEEMKNYESYKLFNEMYPDNYEQIHKQRDGDTSLEIFAYNFDTGNRLELNLRYSVYDQDIRERASCDMNLNTYRIQLGTNAAFASASSDLNFQSSVPTMFYKEGHASDEFTVDFIKYTNCLEITRQGPESHE